MIQVDAGLTNIIVTNSSITDIDGAVGRLAYRGIELTTLANSRRFEEVAGLLWSESPQAVTEKLAAGRCAAWRQLPHLGRALQLPNGMDALRAGLAQLNESTDPVAACAVFVAAWSRTQAGSPPIAPDPSCPHAEDYLRMLGQPTPPSRVRALEAYLIAVMDHGLNASTFAARVVTSTRSDEVSAMVAAVGALKGPLHGGAPGPVLDMLDAIGQVERAREWLTEKLDSGERVMGMGHRVYRVRDPRAAVLETALQQLAYSPRLQLAHGVEEVATALLAERHPDRPLRANVEFYTAVLLEALGLHRTLFAPTFAVARSAGWRAHIREQRETGKLIRPKAQYTGPAGAAVPQWGRLPAV